MTLAEPTESDIDHRGLRRALGAIGWGVVIASLCNVGFSTSQGASRSSIDVGAIAGLVVVVVGLVDLPFDRGPADLRSRRRVLVFLVVASIVANVGTLVPALNPVLAVVGDLITWTWLILLLVLVGRVMAHLQAGELATRWRQLTVAWLALGAAWLACTAVVALAFHETPRGSGGGWRWTHEPNGDHMVWSWFLGSVVLVAIALVAVGITTLVVAIRTLRWIGSRSALDATSTEPSSQPIEGSGSSGPRLGRKGERLVYYVDKDR